MGIQIAKSPSSNHLVRKAFAYCPECKKYLYDNCLKSHPTTENHKTINLSEKKEIFIDKCKEKNHSHKLELYCNEHNVLCCLACISKINKEGYGQHSDCNVSLLEDIKDEKKNKLKENIQNLEELYKQINQTLDKLKEIFKQINKNRNDLQSKIKTIFTKLKDELTKKEKSILSSIDEYYNKVFFNEDLIKESEKLPNKIKKSLEKRKIIDKEWNEKNLSSYINDCINIENYIKEINVINRSIKKYDLNDLNKLSKIDEYIKEEQINNILDNIKNIDKKIKEDILYDNYKIEKKNPIHKLTNHKDFISCLCVLNDGRLVSSSGDNSIIIYNKTTYKPELIIKEHKGYVLCITQLSSGKLASCSYDKTIKLFNIKGSKYDIFQILKNHTDYVYKIIELKNKNLVSCSWDSSIIFYIKDNNEYKQDYKISTNGTCSSIIQTKDNEICYSEIDDNKICFFDFLERKLKASISNISKCNGIREWFIMIEENLLLIPGLDQISIINTEQYNLVRKINVPEQDEIWNCGICILNQNMFLTGDGAKRIIQWKIEEDNLIMVSKKENAHDSTINVLLNIGNGFIASGSDDNSIKIW